MKSKNSKGFSLLEVLLAVVVITIAGLGAYALFDSGVKNTNISDATNEVVEIANVYTDLASSNLTENVTVDDTTNNIANYLKNTGRLSSKYFSASTKTSSNSVSMNNAFGRLDFTAADAYSFTVNVPLGCLPSDSNVPQQFFAKVKDAYGCGTPGNKEFATECVIPCSGGVSTSIILNFDLNT